MPNVFSKCQECIYHTDLPMEHYDNKNYKGDYEKMELLKVYGLPTEVAIKIIKMTYSYHMCDYCTNSLCTLHKNLSLRYGVTWPYVQCHKCYEKRPGGRVYNPSGPFQCDRYGQALRQHPPLSDGGGPSPWMEP